MINRCQYLPHVEPMCSNSLLTHTIIDEFWSNTFHDYALDQSLQLPFDRQDMIDNDRTSAIYSTKFNLPSAISSAILSYASLANATLENLIFTCYYIFLFKLTNGNKDLCVWRQLNLSHPSKLRHPIEIVPFLLRLDPGSSVSHLLLEVQQVSTDTMKHAHIPFSPILQDYSTWMTSVSLDASFDFLMSSINNNITVEQNNSMLFDEMHQLVASPHFTHIRADKQEYNFKLFLNVQYYPDSSTISVTIECTADLFNLATVQAVAERFQILCEQLFCSSFDRNNQPIYELSLLLPSERHIIQTINSCHMISNETDCIHQMFVQKATMHPSKLAVTLDDQCLTYGQLLTRVQQLAWHLINEKDVHPGDIVCQCVDRSIEMVVGIMGIMMSGAVYAPINPNDPFDRLELLVRQTRAKVVLTNCMSHQHVSRLNLLMVDISEILASHNVLSDVEMTKLSEVAVTPECISHIVFTSGSTGIPKAVQIRHRNFMGYMQAHFMQVNDIVLQLASSSFDVHLDEILGALVRGAHLVLLKIGGHLDFDYVTKTINQHKVTFVAPVPSWMNALGKFLSENHLAHDRIRQVRLWYLGGEQLLSSTVRQFLPFVSEQCRILNSYGPAEITEAATFYEVHRNELSTITSIPIGRPMTGYRIYLVDEYRQSVIPGQQGEIVIGGVGVFAGYYGRADLTSQVLIDIDDEQCYITGDLGRLDVRSKELVFMGRRDFQVKLRGQRIELAEIEETIVRGSICVSGCIVVKYTYHEQEHLLAYVEVAGNHLATEELRKYCLSRLPLYMIPSVFICLDRFPLMLNGKVDRKALPPPESMTFRETLFEHMQPATKMEERVHDIWCNVLHMKSISVKSSWFALHGTSLVFVKLYNMYQMEFGIAPDIVDCFRHPSISEHAELVSKMIISTGVEHYQAWSCLNLDQGEASFAQSRIFLDEQIRFHSSIEKTVSVYSLPFLYRLTEGSLSIPHLRGALRQITRKHAILRTSVQLDPINGNLTQYIQPSNAQDWFAFCTSIIDDDNMLESILSDEMTDQTYFDLQTGQIFRCHIVRQRSTIIQDNDDFLHEGDWIIFNFHHIAFDGESEQIFVDDLQKFYCQTENVQVDDLHTALQYIDYSAHERQIDMTLAKIYWHQALLGYNIKKPMALPVDRNVSSNAMRSGQGFSIELQFNSHIVEQLVKYAVRFNVTLYQVCLTIYYVFLFHLTGGQKDLIVGIVQANRYRPELQHIIGMFVNTLPMRLRVNPHDTFDELLCRVSSTMFEAQSHSNLPYQYIIEQVPMWKFYKDNLIQTMFTLDEVETIHIRLDAGIGAPKIAVAMFDMTLSLEHIVETNSLNAELIGSSDIFDSTTLANMARRFQLIVEQLFSPISMTMMITEQLICDLSLILPEEMTDDKQYIQFATMSETKSIARASYAQSRIWVDEQINSDPEAAIRNRAYFYRLSKGSLSVERLRRALRLVVLKHSSLRTLFLFDSKVDCLMQRIIQYNDNGEELFTFVHSTFKDGTNLNKIMLDELHNPLNFDLFNGCVFRVHIIVHDSSNDDQLQIGDYLFFNFHPIVFDTPSFAIFYQVLCMAYEYGTTSPYSDQHFRYIDYVVAEQLMPMKPASIFWHEIMFDYDWNRHLNFPIDHKYKSYEKQTGFAYSATVKLHDDLATRLSDYASAMKMSLLPLLLTCYYLFLFKFTNGETDLCIGVHASNRDRLELQNIIGTFINIVPLRFQINPIANFKHNLSQITKLYHQSMKHAYYPLQRILKTISLPTTTSTKVAFNFEINDTQSIQIDTAQFEHVPISVVNDSFHENRKVISRFDLSLTIQYNQRFKELSCTFDGSCDLFNLATVQAVAERFQILCEQLFCSSFDRNNQPIYELSLLLPSERHIIQTINSCHMISNETDCIHQMFVQKATMHPSKLAVTLDDQCLTYGQLLTRVQQLAWHLINEKDVHPGDIVCQCVDRSIEMVVGIMGIMMSGAVYAPINPNDPFDRLELLVRQTRAKVVLTNCMSHQHVSRLNLLMVDISEILASHNVLSDVEMTKLSEVAVTPECISHIVFTSGSTGIPKAVQIRHRNFMGYMQAHFMQVNDIVLQLASSSFDVHLDEILGALVRGAHLVLLKIGGHLDFDYVTKTINQHKVTFVAPVPSWMNALGKFLSENHLAHDRIRQVRLWYLGGEQLLSSTVRQFLPFVSEQCRILNSYGPAEITEAATFYEVHRNELSTITSIPIGRPMTGYRIYLVDEYRQSVIPGQQGEIVIGGVGVFAGYYGRADLTSQVLIDIDDEQCYITGDLGRLDVRSKELVFMGRRDFQVKLRGQRIELAEIEAVIMKSSPSIVSCVVMKENFEDDNYLAAYVQVKDSNENERNQEKVISACQDLLPSYMIPSKWFLIPELPLNANGKIDRSALREIGKVIDLPSDNVTSRSVSPLERKLQEIFVRAFHLESSPDVKSSFGQLGGTSLGAMFALNLIREEVFEKMDINLLFANPSVQKLAVALEPLLSGLKSDEDNQDDDGDFSIRPCSSWLIETMGILLLIWQWLWPIFVVIRLNSLFFQVIFIPLMHLLQYPLFMKLFGESSWRYQDRLYSWRYYRLWFLRRQWSLNTYWLSHLLGTPFYNTYLRLCGAYIGNGTYIYTYQIDAPWLLKIGDGTYIGNEVILSSLTYHDCTYALHQIRIGSYCSIGARCVLHDRVDIHDHVLIEPLTTVTGRILETHSKELLSCIMSCGQSFFQLVAIFTITSIHALILKLSWLAVHWLPLWLSLSACWLIWSIIGAGISLLLLRFIVGHIQQNFAYSLNSWKFLSQFWLRHLVLSSFDPCLSTVFDEFNSFTPLILRWLGVSIEPDDIEIAHFVPLLLVPPNLLVIGHGVTITSDVYFVPFDVTTNSQCIVSGQIQIGHRSFLGNNCVLRSGVCLPADVLVGCLTRVDLTTNSMKEGDILLGIPARIMPFVSPNAERPDTLTEEAQTTKRAMIGDFQRLFMNFTNILLLIVSAILSLNITSRCHTFEERSLKLRPVTIGPGCILQPMSMVLPGVTLIGYNRLAPCSLALPHDRFAAHTDWSDCPTKRVIAHHGSEPPQLILAERQSSLGTYNVSVGRFTDDILVLFFGQNGWLGWQSGINLRRPYKPCDIYIKLFFTSFICKPKAKQVLIIGLGGGVLPMLIRHYFPTVIIHVVEIDATVIELASEFFYLTEQIENGYMHVIADDGFLYASETAHRYDIIFIDAFVEDAMPSHMNTSQFFSNLHGILKADGCLVTNANLPTNDVYDRLIKTCSSTFESNVLFAHTNIIENARVIISGTRTCLTSISSSTKATQEAQWLESGALLEFSLSRLVTFAYRGLLTDNDTRIST
ncbi:unnamed protein product [Rotaria magnacalcarata]|uniref:Non-ribosomal peptide synthetase n=3 Tax=Rotaria magnacalcarata TaxID=392030 RepID=A0A818ZMU8_9BILA|nr:unnamed protein product [Rotaria magnacalcarata]